MTPFWSDDHLTLYGGDCREVLRELPDESVHCVVTSPPYWGLRDYGTASWDGGDTACDHKDAAPSRDSDEDVQRRKATYQAEGRSTGQHGGWESRATRADGSRVCRCGARRIDSQLGLEATPEAFVANMMDVFREVRRVLRKDGTLWLNLGDSFGDKQLWGIPWRVAFALQADGWYLRSDIIWAKPNPMPESVTDRPTKAHEYLFLLTRSPRYYYDAEAVREPVQESTIERSAYGFREYNERDTLTRPTDAIARKALGLRADAATATVNRSIANGRNLRSVWNIATEPYPGAHFATFPRKLVEPCVKAGCPEGGTVLDPFAGSGTTLLVAQSLGRRGIGIDLSPDYLKQALERNRQTPLGLVG